VKLIFRPQLMKNKLMRLQFLQVEITLNSDVS